MLTPTIDTNTAPQPTRTTQNDLGKKDIFLKLLVAQMQHQDPLKPQDATKMSSQLAQFNMVEQQTKSNKLLEQLVASSGGGSNNAVNSSNGASYLGHTVTFNQNSIYYNGTSQTSTVNLSEPATKAIAYIFDGNGNPIKTINLSNLPAGPTKIVWNGTTDSGAKAPQGNYTIEVSASNANGGTVKNSIQRAGVVNAVRFNANGTELVVGGVTVSIDKVAELRL